MRDGGAAPRSAAAPASVGGGQPASGRWEEASQLVGRIVHKAFYGHGTFRGEVVGVSALATGGLFFRVRYTDGDEETMVSYAPSSLSRAPHAPARAAAAC
jgi:hypothetical protein